MVHRAVHRLDVIFDALDFHGRIHRFGIIGQVAGPYEQVFLRDVRGPDPQIACFVFHLFCQAFKFINEDTAIRQPKWQPGTDLIFEDEDFQVLAQFAVVTRLGFLDHLEVVL